MAQRVRGRVRHPRGERGATEGVARPALVRLMAPRRPFGRRERWSRIYTMGWISLYDQAPHSSHDEVNGGLLDYRGGKKPSYFAYRRG